MDRSQKELKSIIERNLSDFFKSCENGGEVFGEDTYYYKRIVIDVLNEYSKNSYNNN